MSSRTDIPLLKRAASLVFRVLQLPYHMAFFLAAITARLLSRILGALDAPFGPIVAKRGEAGAGAGGSAGVGSAGVGGTMARASASVTPRRVANSCTDRAGASP